MLKSIAQVARHRRHRIFMQYIKSFKNPPSVLDVGGTIEYWRMIRIDQSTLKKLVLLNTFQQPNDDFIETVIGDARDLSRYSDKAFDVVFSNSVIGHVGNFDDQLRMAQEIRRVGRHYFVQTPNHDFPIDWRTLVPFFASFYSVLVLSAFLDWILSQG